VHLNLYLSRSGVASRRSSAEIVKAGRVQVNGRTVREPGRTVEPDDLVLVDGLPVKPEPHVYLALNKPSGYTSTVKDRFAPKKVLELVPSSFGRLYPVGRLDRDSCGLLLLTNDGDFAQRIIHPGAGVEKEYEVTVSPTFRQPDAALLRQGLNDQGELLSVRSVARLQDTPHNSLLKVILTEGRKRAIRRLFRRLGYRVEKLKRVRIGRILLGGLAEGRYRMLKEDELQEYLNP